MHGEAAYRNKKHKGLNSIKNHNGSSTNGSDKLETNGSIITTTATIHQAPINSNNLATMNSDAPTSYPTTNTNGLVNVKSEFNPPGLNDNQITSNIQMDTTALIGNGSTLNQMNGNFPNSRHPTINGHNGSAQLTGQFHNDLLNHSSKLENSVSLIDSTSYNPNININSSSFSFNNHLNSNHNLANHLITTKNEPTQFNDLNNYNSSYGNGNMLDTINHNNSQHQPPSINDTKQTLDVNKTHQINSSTNWTPGQLNSYNDYNNQNQRSSDYQMPVMNANSNHMMSHPNSNSILYQSNLLNHSNSSLIKSRGDLSHCLSTNDVDEGIGSESVTCCTDDEESSNSIAHHYGTISSSGGGSSLMVMTQHQPLARTNIKSNRPFLGNILKNIKNSIQTKLFHKNSSTTTEQNCQQPKTDYQYGYTNSTSVDQTSTQLQSLNCSNYQPINSNCNSRQSESKKKSGKDSSLSLKVPFLNKSRKNKVYEDNLKDQQISNQQQQLPNLEDSEQSGCNITNSDFPDDFLNFLEEKNKGEAVNSNITPGPLSPNSSILTQVSPSQLANTTLNNDCNVKLTQLNNSCIPKNRTTVSNNCSTSIIKQQENGSTIHNQQLNQPFSPMSINSSPNTPAAIMNSLPLSPMQTDLVTNMNVPNVSNVVNKPPPAYSYATQQQQQPPQQQQIDQLNTNFNNNQSTYLNQPQSFNQSSNYNSNYNDNYNSSTNYFNSNYQINNQNLVPNNDYNQVKPASSTTINNNGCTDSTSRIDKYINNQNINIFINGQNDQANTMMPPQSFYNPIYTPQSNYGNSYSNWHPHQSQHQQSQSRQSAMSIDTNNNSNGQNNYIKYPYQSANHMQTPQTNYTQQLPSQLTPPIPSSLLLNNQNSNQMTNLNDMCSPRPMSVNRCDSRALISPMQICDESSGNMVMNDLQSSLSILIDENRLFVKKQ